MNAEYLLVWTLNLQIHIQDSLNGVRVQNLRRRFTSYVIKAKEEYEEFLCCLADKEVTKERKQRIYNIKVSNARKTARLNKQLVNQYKIIISSIFIKSQHAYNSL